MTEGDLSGAVLDGRYKVIEPINEGAMGVVYRAERLKLGRIVAIKVLHDSLPNELSSRKRFEIEAMAMAKLEHPHCAAVLDVGLHDGKPFVVMDFVSGIDLKKMIAQGPMPVARAVEIVRQVLSGLAHAHELGIVHRDIKPANIVLSQKAGLGDHVKILDFGLARLTANQTSNLTSGIVVGTPAYMAPEQIRGVLIDGRADLYACGVLLFELVTGHKPFHSEKDDPIEVVSMHLNRPPPRLADMLPGHDFGELEAIVAKALAKKADDRYQSATEFVAALARPAIEPIAREPSGRVEDPSLSIPQEYAGTRLGIAVATGPTVAAPMPHVASAPVAIPQVASAPVIAPVIAPVASPAPVPPARPVVPARPAGSPFTHRQLAIAGGGLLAVIVVIAIIAGTRGGSSSGAAPADAPAVVTAPAPTPAGDPAGDVIARATDLAASGDREAAIELLARSRRAYPANPQIPYLAGKLYFAKLWWTDGLKSFRDAIRIDPTYRSDPDLIKIVLKGFITTPSYNDELASFLRNDIGAPAQPYLEETAHSHPNASVRARASGELRRMH